MEFSDAWREKEFNSISYDLSYEVDPNLPIADEAIELGKFIEVRARENLMLLEKTGRI